MKHKLTAFMSKLANKSTDVSKKSLTDLHKGQSLNDKLDNIKIQDPYSDSFGYKQSNSVFML